MGWIPLKMASSLLRSKAQARLGVKKPRKLPVWDDDVQQEIHRFKNIALEISPN